jgi:hypothetical protein
MDWSTTALIIALVIAAMVWLTDALSTRSSET